MGEEFCVMLEKIFQQSVYLLKLWQQKVFLLKLIYGKRLVSCSYNPHRDNISKHLQTISKSLYLYLSQYDSIIIVGDSDTEISENFMNAFCERYSLRSLIKEPVCYKNPANPSCIDLILTNSPRSFQNSSVVETGMSDFHRMIVITVLKTIFQRLPPKIRNYRDYSNFENGMFRECLFNDLSKEDVRNLKKFIKVCINTLNNYAQARKDILEVIIYHL